jgi:hypothetical protein
MSTKTRLRAFKAYEEAEAAYRAAGGDSKKTKQGTPRSELGKAHKAMQVAERAWRDEIR